MLYVTGLHFSKTTWARTLDGFCALQASTFRAPWMPQSQGVGTRCNMLTPQVLGWQGGGYAKAAARGGSGFATVWLHPVPISLGLQVGV